MFTFIETRLFTRIVGQYLSDDEYAELQLRLASDPAQAPVIQGTGGVRKLRWGQPGRGKRGGVRVIYYVRAGEGVIWMLTIYAKNEAQSIAADVLRRIREEIDG
jgi:mRNA-degrading endonuclease RelE of RelBE toxin-antitoxin system